MGHNNVVSGKPKSTRIPQVDRLSTGPPDLGRHNITNYYPQYTYLSSIASIENQP